MNSSDWEQWNGHGSGVIWLTGLSGSGKTTLSSEAQRELSRRGIRCIVLDGDQLRQGLNRDLGFSPEDRQENMRRAAEVAAMFADASFIVLVSMISPSEAARSLIRRRFPAEKYTEVYVKCSLEVCEQRDPKGLYRKARAGEIPDFTGIGSIYEPPSQPDLIIDTETDSLEKSAGALVDYIEQRYKNKVNTF